MSVYFFVIQETLFFPLSELPFNVHYICIGGGWTWTLIYENICCGCLIMWLTNVSGCLVMWLKEGWTQDEDTFRKAFNCSNSHVNWLLRVRVNTFFLWLRHLNLGAFCLMWSRPRIQQDSCHSPCKASAHVLGSVFY